MTLAEKYDRYLTWIPQHQDKYGFIDTAHCDSLLFSGLASMALNVEIEVAFDGKLWHRRPGCDCYPDHSKSTISRDMLTGVLWYCWIHDRKDIATDIVTHALKNFGIMGKGVDLATTWGRCQIGPGLLSTFALMSGKWWLKPLTWIPADVKLSSIPTGYAAHIQVLHLLVRYLIQDKDPRSDPILLAQAVRQPNNPLFQMAVGNWERAERVLGDERLWPSHRLPTTHDRRESWLPQRDEGKDWLPARGPAVKHHGGDYIWLYTLLLFLKGKYA